MVGASKALTAALALALSTAVNGYWLMGADFLTTERLDPLVSPGVVSGHVHSVVGGSNFGFEISTESLTKSQCTSVPIKEDKSNYWFPHLYFQWANGSFSSVGGGAVIYYLFPDKAGTTTAFPPNFRMISGNPKKRSYDANSYASQAIDFLCLDFNGQTTRHQALPEKSCPSGIRSQVNFPSCWNGKDLDSPDHKSHVAYRSGGPDKGDCKDPNFPVSLPRIFLEVYWGTGEWDKLRSQAMKPSQPFVFAYGDRTGYGNHADFFNGWEPGVLQRAVDGCNCNIYGDPQCCSDKGIFTLVKDNKCRITKQVDEVVTGMLPKLPGNNPVQEGPGDAQMLTSNVIPAKIAPAYVYTGNSPTTIGKVVVPATTIGAAPPPPSSSAAVPTSLPPVVSSSAPAPPSSSVVLPAPSSAPAGGSSSAAASSSVSVIQSTVNSGPTQAPAPSSAVVVPSPSNPAPSSSIDVAPPGIPPSSSAPVTGQPTASSHAASPSSPVVVQPPVDAPSSSPAVVHPPASTSSNAPAITLAPSPTALPVTGKPTSVKTWVSTRWIKPTAGCKPKKNLHGHHNHRPRSPFKRRYDFPVDDYYYVH